MFDLVNLIHASNIQLGYVITAVIMFIIYRLFLCLSVHTDGNERNVYRKGIWSISSLLFGVVAAIIYAVCNREKEKKLILKRKKFFICVLIISLILSVFARTLFGLSFTGEFGYVFNPEIAFDETSVVTYEDDKGRKVIFDKMGNSYTYSQRYDLMYYDESGNSYKCLDNTWSTFLNTVNQQIYSEDDYDFYINDEGYFCIFENLYELSEFEYAELDIVCYDDQHLYFSLPFINWDREGDVVFPQFIDEMNNITYEMVKSEN